MFSVTQTYAYMSDLKCVFILVFVAPYTNKMIDSSVVFSSPTEIFVMFNSPRFPATHSPDLLL